MLSHLKRLQILLAREKKTVSAAEPVNFIFKSNEEPIKFFAKAKTAVTIVDNLIGPTTLACVGQVKHPIRLLTGKDERSLPAGFNDNLKAFKSGGHDIEVRRHVVLNDRYLFLNGRCWLTNTSLKNVGQKPLSIIECIDCKAAIAKAIEQKWREAEIYQI
jgi:hypothetical protein